MGNLWVFLIKSTASSTTVDVTKQPFGEFTTNDFNSWAFSAAHQHSIRLVKSAFNGNGRSGKQFSIISLFSSLTLSLSLDSRYACQMVPWIPFHQINNNNQMTTTTTTTPASKQTNQKNRIEIDAFIPRVFSVLLRKRDDRFRLTAMYVYAFAGLLQFPRKWWHWLIAVQTDQKPL